MPNGFLTVSVIDNATNRPIENAIVNRTPTGTIIPTVDALSAGTNTKSTSIRRTGAIAIFQLFATKATPSAPKSAGRS